MKLLVRQGVRFIRSEIRASISLGRVINKIFRKSPEVSQSPVGCDMATDICECFQGVIALHEIASRASRSGVLKRVWAHPLMHPGCPLREPSDPIAMLGRLPTTSSAWTAHKVNCLSIRQREFHIRIFGDSLVASQPRNERAYKIWAAPSLASLLKRAATLFAEQ